MTERKSAGRKKAQTSARRTGTAKTTAAKPKATAAKKTAAKSRKWSAEVTDNSDAMDLKDGVFKGRDPHKIALSLKHSAETSSRRKGGAFQSAMSMLTFYINRAGHNLSPARLKILDRAKDELRTVFGRED